MSIALLVFHLDILGKDNKDLQLENIWLILIALCTFHLDISGKDIKDLQLENI